MTLLLISAIAVVYCTWVVHVAQYFRSQTRRLTSSLVELEAATRLLVQVAGDFIKYQHKRNHDLLDALTAHASRMELLAAGLMPPSYEEKE